MANKIVELFPVADVSSTWTQVPNDGLAQYLKLDEGSENHDDVTSYIVTGTQHAVARFRMTAMPSDMKSSVFIEMHGWAQADDEFNTADVDFFINGEPAGISTGVSFTSPGAWQEFGAVLSPILSLRRTDTLEVRFTANIAFGSIYLTAFDIHVEYTPSPWVGVPSADGSWSADERGAASWTQNPSGGGSWTPDESA